MRKVTMTRVVCAALPAILAAGAVVARGRQPAVNDQKTPAAEAKAEAMAGAVPRLNIPHRSDKMTDKKNPTTADGRGAPSLDDVLAPAAWAYIDGQAGRFVDSAGKRRIPWQIETPVKTSPSFRVEVYIPLLGKPRDFAATLDTLDSASGRKVAYGIKADAGTFVVGRSYPLLTPGKNFTVRNRLTGDVVSHIAPLAPGTYLFAVKIANARTGKEGLAVTRFTVASE